MHQRRHTTTRGPIMVQLQCPRCGRRAKGLRDEVRHCHRCEQSIRVLTEMRPVRRDRAC